MEPGIPRQTIKKGRSVFVQLLQNGQKNCFFFVCVCVGAAGLLVPPGSKMDWNRARTSHGRRPRHRLVINMVRANYSRNKQLICVIINSPGCGRWQGAWLPICSQIKWQAMGGSNRRRSVSHTHTGREREKVSDPILKVTD